MLVIPCLAILNKSAHEHIDIVNAILDSDDPKARGLTYHHVVVSAEELLDIANILSSR